MNTDNMSILGITIDYGPFGFMEYFNPRLVSNHSDQEARYCYENQPSVCKYNLLRLSEALDPLLPLEWSSNYINSNFDELYTSSYLGMMARKLGFITEANSEKEELSDQEFGLIESLFNVLKETSTDFTNTFRALMKVSRSPDFTAVDQQALDELVKNTAPIEHLKASKKPKYSPVALAKIKQLLETNPDILPMFGIDPDQALLELASLEKL
jgi:uncharacterized protein YdiU (UPF0061 family)